MQPAQGEVCLLHKFQRRTVAVVLCAPKEPSPRTLRQRTSAPSSSVDLVTFGTIASVALTIAIVVGGMWLESSLHAEFLAVRTTSDAAFQSLSADLKELSKELQSFNEALSERQRR